LGGSVHSVKENAEALVVASKESGVAENADKPKYVVMSEDRNAERSHNLKIPIGPLKGCNSLNIWEKS